MGGPIEVHQLDPKSQEKLRGLYGGNFLFAEFGDNRCIMPLNYKEDMEIIRNMVVRPDDLWVTTFPRSGTTLTQELVWMLTNNFDYETALRIPLTGRYMLLESNHLLNLESAVKDEWGPEMIKNFVKSMPPYGQIVKAPSPRFIKTHLPFSLLPENLVDVGKVVYVARDPRDVAVSRYHYRRLFGYSRDFKTFWNLFIQDLMPSNPFFPHLKEAWALRDHPNMLFMFYEEMIKDLPSCIKRVADFLGKEPTNEQIMKLCEHLDIKNFRLNQSVNPPWMNLLNPNAGGFVRKGISGGWVEYFDEEMAAQAQAWMRDNLADTDLRFPDASSKVAI